MNQAVQWIRCLPHGCRLTYSTTAIISHIVLKWTQLAYMISDLHIWSVICVYNLLWYILYTIHWANNCIFHCARVFLIQYWCKPPHVTGFISALQTTTTVNVDLKISSYCCLPLQTRTNPSSIFHRQTAHTRNIAGTRSLVHILWWLRRY